MTGSVQQVAPADFRYAVSQLLSKMAMHEIACASDPDRKEASAAAVAKAREEVEAMLEAPVAPSTDAVEAARYRDILEHVVFVPSGISGTFGLNYRAPTNWRDYASDAAMFAATVDASRGLAPAENEHAMHVEDLAAAFGAAVDDEYPLPDSPHASVIQHAVDNRAAMWRGIRAAHKVLGSRAAPAGAAGEGQQSFSARVWKRDSTSEWVLELQGVINDNAFVCRHTEPLSTPIEDVPGLPTLHAAIEARGAALTDAAALLRPLVQNGTPVFIRAAAEVLEKIEAAMPGIPVADMQGAA